MEIEQQIWGATSEGEAVVLYTLRNAAGAEVRLCNVGAAVVSILVPDRDGHLADVALGYKDFRSYFGDPALCGKSIGRVAGCIAYGTMRIDGEEYRLDINGMAGHLNGGVKGFAGRLWESRVETNRVVMSLSSDDGDQGWVGRSKRGGRADRDLASGTCPRGHGLDVALRADDRGELAARHADPDALDQPAELGRLGAEALRRREVGLTRVLDGAGHAVDELAGLCPAERRLTHGPLIPQIAVPHHSPSYPLPTSASTAGAARRGGATSERRVFAPGGAMARAWVV